MHLALRQEVFRVDLARHQRQLARGRARRPRGDRLVAQEPVPCPPRVAEGARFDVRVQVVVRVEAPEGIFLAPDVEVCAGCS